MTEHSVDVEVTVVATQSYSVTVDEEASHDEIEAQEKAVAEHAFSGVACDTLDITVVVAGPTEP